MALNYLFFIFPFMGEDEQVAQGDESIPAPETLVPGVEDPIDQGEQAMVSFGQKAVGLSFNPSNDPVVQEIKLLYAKIIDKLNALRGDERNERARLLSVAITEAQGAQMWAVKGATWKE